MQDTRIQGLSDEIYNDKELINTEQHLTNGGEQNTGGDGKGMGMSSSQMGAIGGYGWWSCKYNKRCNRWW